MLKVVGSKAGWLIQPTDVKLGDKLGKGATATVYKSIWHGLDVAVKTIDPKLFEEDPGGLVSFCRELEILARQRHPFVLPFFAATLDYPERCWVVTDVMKQTLVEWLHGTRERQYSRLIPLPPMKERVRVALEIALGMQHLHEQVPMVIHRDLKPSNVFLDSRGRAYVSDFGFARILEPQDCDQTGETGTYMYMAPEVIRYEHYNEKCDVYSFGILLNELMCGYPPYIQAYLSPIQIAKGVSAGDLRPFLAKDADPLTLELIEACWANEPSSRPAFGQITLRLREILANVDTFNKNGKHHSDGQEHHGIIGRLFHKSS